MRATNLVVQAHPMLMKRLGTLASRSVLPASAAAVTSLAPTHASTCQTLQQLQQQHQQQGRYHRHSQLSWFSNDASKKSTESPSTTGEEVQEELADVVNESKHDDKNLAGDRASYTVPITIKMPDMSEDSKDNIVEEWYKQPGDIIKRNDVLCDITTPDFTFGMVTEDDHDAIMGEIYVEAGQSAADGQPICIIYHPEPEKPATEKPSETAETNTSASTKQ